MARRRRNASSPRPLQAPPRSGSAIVCGLAIVAVVAVPALFNPRGQAAFGVVKAGLTQVLGLLAGMVAVLEVWHQRERLGPPALLAAGGVVLLAFAVATAAGVAPALSFHGPGARGEGLYVLLALGAIAFGVSTLDVAQTDAVIAAMIAGSIGPSLYAIVELFTNNVSAVDASLQRPGSTLGNPILFAGYLVTLIPLTVAAALAARGQTSDSVAAKGRAAGLWLVLALQMTALAATRAKGAAIALGVAALVAVVATVDLASRRRRVVAAIVAACVAASVVIGAAFVQQRDGTLVVGRTLQVRVLIWRDAMRLISSNPGRLAFGYGPEMLQSMVAPFYTPDIAAFEGTFSIPDRAHNDLLDTVVAAGLVGACAVVALHALLWTQLVALVRSGAYAASPPWRWLTVGLLASAVAHFVDIQTGIATTSSRLVWWCCLGVVAARGRALRRHDAAGEPAALDAVIWLAGGVGVSALVFDFWQPNAGLSDAAVVVIGATVAMTAVLVGAWRTRLRGRSSVGRAAALAAAMVAVMIVMLALWDAGARRNAPQASELVAEATWSAHQATACLVFFTIVAVAIAATLGLRPRPPVSARRVMIASASAAIAVALVISAARPARADVLARIGEQLSGLGRWVDAGQVEEQRAQLTPESDRAWAALGGVDLEIAQRAAAPERPGAFRRAADALAQARRRNPFEWLHIRNQASAERLWAAADREGRAAHLAEADRFFREASERAPAFARLWSEWGNVDAERGHFRSAFEKLERAISLHGEFDATVVANAIMRATGVDLRDPASLARAAAELDRQGFHRVAALYARQ